MGLNIRDIVPRKELKIENLKGKIICVDAFNTLYQFLTTIRQVDGTPLMDSKKRVTSHLSGLFYRNINLLSEGIKPVYVFDGKAPDLKGKIHEVRQGNREKAKERYDEAKDNVDIEGMRRYSSQLIRLNDEMIAESKELLGAMGIPVVQAPGEGEAEASYLARTNKEIYAVASQDYDSLLFGAPMLIQNLTLASKKKTISGWIEVHPEVIEIKRVLNLLEIDIDQLICLGILVGTDYNPKGVPGIGPKKAIQLVKQFKQPVLIFKAVEDQINNLQDKDKFNWQDIFHIFKKPDVKDAKEFKFGKLDEEKIKELLVKEHEFSESRVEKQFEKLEKAKRLLSQKTLF